MPAPVSAETGRTVALPASAPTLSTTAASVSSSTSSTLLTATTSAVPICAVTSGSTTSSSISQRAASTSVSTRMASTSGSGRPRCPGCRRGRQAGGLDDHPVRLVAALDGEERLDQAGLQRAADAAAEELLHGEPLLAHVAAVDAHLADLVLDDGELQRRRRPARGRPRGERSSCRSRGSPRCRARSRRLVAVRRGRWGGGSAGEQLGPEVVQGELVAGRGDDEVVAPAARPRARRGCASCRVRPRPAGRRRGERRRVPGGRHA